MPPIDVTPIRKMKVGQCGWTVPWMCFEKDGLPWLGETTGITKEGGGTATMRVERVKGGYRVWEPFFDKTPLFMKWVAKIVFVPDERVGPRWPERKK